jgi:hypothetical protein
MNKKYFLSILLAVCLLKQNHAQCLSGDCQDGLGTYIWDSGDEFTGQWTGGVRTRIGVYDWKDGSYYYGYFQDGKLEGKGVYLGNDDAKTTLIGYFHDGTLSTKENFVATGCILGDCQDGIGVYLWDTDDVFLGKWTNGNRTGYGRYDWKDGSYYTGYFKEGKLDGRGYYSSADGKNIMDGYFENGTFTKSVSSSGSSSSTPGTASQPGGSTTTTEAKTYNDVCSLLQTVITTMPDDFADVTGSMINNYLISDWNSTVKLYGSDEAKLLSGFTDISTPNMWYNEVYSSASQSDAQGKYKSYSSQFKSCTNSCCSLTSTVKNVDSTNTYTTTFNVSNVNSGYSADYNDMEIVFQLKKDYDDLWKVEIQVYNLAEF